VTYKELLLDDNWRNRRNEILLRDKLQCTSCLNEKLVSPSVPGALVLKGKNDQGILYGFLGSHKSGISSSKHIFLQGNATPIIGIIKQGDIVYIDTDSTTEQFLKILGVRKYVQQDINAVGKRFSPDYESFPFADNFEAFEWKYVPGLHVHHKYYQVNLMPWQYPDDALQTLCWVCHEDLHKHTKIDLRDENGKVLGKLTPCHRCYGAGVFPEYKHIIAGLCFHCRGAKYEEMIVKDN